MPIDWRQFHATQHQTPAVVDPRRRMRICLAVFAAAVLVVFGRIVQLEVSQGAGFREAALRPIEKQIVLPAPRGRILARDGAVLACDRTVEVVAVHYRWLQEPPDRRWLRTMVRSRLSKADRKTPRKLAAEETKVLAEREDLARRLAKLCGLSPEQWVARTQRIQARVETIAAAANRRRQSETADAADADPSWAVRIRRLLLEEPPPPRIIVAEELTYHVVANEVPASAIAEIKSHADRYPGTRIEQAVRRTYPGGALAAHVVGHLGPVGKKELAEQATGEAAYLPDELIGRIGVERQCEAVLRGRRGEAIERTDRSGRVIGSYSERQPIAGCDVMLTLNTALQRTAEELLRSGLERRAIGPAPVEPAGGAIAVMDVHDGAIHAAASIPSFDPSLFVGGKDGELASLLADKAHPLFDRVCSMAIAPGSTFKVVAAAALLQQGTVDPQEPFLCRGYLNQPDRQRCEIYVRQGVGHGEVNLADALAVSCNVYFFHFAGPLGPRPLVDWAERFGFGRPTGIDLPGEAVGMLPNPENIRRLEGHAWRTADTQALAIGQGSLTATPLQMLRMMAAVANGGRLVTPHIKIRGRESLSEEDQSDPFLHARRQTLQAIREGLRRVVADSKGTAHATVCLKSIPVAGKTGTAETAENRASHAWFVGYVPADQPKLAFVVVLERAGDAAVAAGPLAKRLVLRMEQLGML